MNKHRIKPNPFPAFAGLLAAGYLLLASGCRKQPDPTDQHNHRATGTEHSDGGQQNEGMAMPMPPAATDAPASAMKMEGMDMRTEGPAGHTDDMDMSGMVKGRAAVRLEPAQRQLINIRTTPAEIAPAVVTIRAVGIVAYDETRLADVNTRISGWAEKLYVDKPGQFVKRGAPIMDIYSPELYSAQYEYLLAFRRSERLKQIASSTNNFTTEAIGRESVEEAETLVQSARKRLKLWGITEDEIAALETSGSPTDTLQLRSPVGGYVIEKNLDPSQMVMSGKTLYRLADLGTVWVNAEIYEYELPLVKAGQQARVTTAAYPDRVFDATVDFIYPYTGGKTRTTKVRFVLDNEGGLFKPDMYVNAAIEVNLGERLLIPRDAVFDTGRRRYVFVEEKEGSFVPRSVEVGSRVDGRIVVTGGLTEGEEVVVDGNFLLDSESQLRSTGTGGGHQH